MGAKFSSGGGATVFYDKTDTPGEIVTELVNASDGAGLHFESGGYIELANSAAAEFGTSDFSVEFVLNQKEANVSSNNIFRYPSSGDNRMFIQHQSGTTKITFRDTSDAVYDLGYDMSADYGTPTHYVLTADRDGNALLYKNGNQVGSVDISASSSVNIGSGNTGVGAIGSSSANYTMLGTFYRFRTWNKALTSTEVQTAYERADVDFADQYGSQSELVTNGTFAADSNWTKGTGWSIAGGAAVATSAGSGVQLYQTVSGLSVGKKYRLSFEVSAFTSGSVKAYAISTTYSTSTLSATGSATVEFTATATSHLVSVITQSASTSLSVDNVSVVQIGCVSDYDLAFANPTQSLTVQDRAGAADGTCSASGVTQVQPVVQLNSTSARIGTSTLQPADGELMVDSVDVRNGNVRVIGGNQVQLLNAANDTNVDIINSGGTGVAQLGLRVAGSEKVTIGANGNVLVGAAALDANLGAKKMQLEGSASTSVGPEMLLHNSGQGSGAASLLTFGGKASGTEGYTAAIKATNTGTLTIGTAHASGGFSEPAAALTINSTGDVSCGIGNSKEATIQSTNSGRVEGNPAYSFRGDLDTGMFNPNTDNTLAFATGGTERMRIDSTGNIEQHTDSNGIVKFVVKNESTGTSARAMVNVISDHGNLDLSMNGTNYTGVAGWADSGVVSTGSVVGGGLKLNAVAGGLALQTNQTTRVSIANSTGLATFSGGIAQGGTSGSDEANIDTSGVLRIRRDSGVGRDNITFTNGGTAVGSITSNTSATQYNTSSDYRLKENLTPLTGALDRLDALPVYRFNFKADPDTTVDGFVAHEVQAHVPEAITGEKDAMKTVVVQEAVEAVEAVAATYWEEGDELPEGVAVGDEKTAAVEAVEAVAEVTEEQPDYQGIDQSKLVPLLVAAVKELKAKVETLENA
ncbi:MAG: tail fiber domain-containing protein [Rhodospirillales bacterium]